jgi:DNA adenine methylase
MTIITRENGRARTPRAPVDLGPGLSIPALPDPKPVLKFAGGKARQALSIVEALGPLKKGRKYIEPFFGGGAVFFARKAPSAMIGDKNKRLMQLYATLRSRSEEVIECLTTGDTLPWGLSVAECRPEYARIRASFNRDALTDAWTAAHFVWLNKHDFNGMFRENRHGGFNVPIGSWTRPPSPPTPEALRSVARALQAVSVIWSGDYAYLIDQAEAGDQVYADPPYVPVSATSAFTEYVAGGFTGVDQGRLADALLAAVGRGATVVASNSSAPAVRSIYGSRGFAITEITASRSISAKGSRQPVTELRMVLKP